MSVALLQFGSADAKGTAEYCLMFDKFFDCMNVRNSVEHIHKRKPFLAPYTSVDDDRFSWLLDTFLPYFSKWKKSLADRPGNFTPADKSRMFISWQTHEALNVTTSSIIDITKYLLNAQWVIATTTLPSKSLATMTTLFVEQKNLGQYNLVILDTHFQYL